ncbi:MAG: hypothetical protein AAB288_09230, partial [Acidobacteriota bacterium]
MRRFYYRFRFMLMAVGLGLAAVYMWQGLSLGWWCITLELPGARSANVFEVVVPPEEKPQGPNYVCDEISDENERASCLHRLIFGDRNMSLYNDAGRQGCGLDRSLL